MSAFVPKGYAVGYFLMSAGSWGPEQLAKQLVSWTIFRWGVSGVCGRLELRGSLRN